MFPEAMEVCYRIAEVNYKEVSELLSTYNKVIIHLTIQDGVGYYITINQFKMGGKNRYTGRLWIDQYPVYWKRVIVKHGVPKFQVMEADATGFTGVPLKHQVIIKNIIYLAQKTVEPITGSVVNALDRVREYKGDYYDMFWDTFLVTRYNKRTYTIEDEGRADTITFVRSGRVIYYIINDMKRYSLTPYPDALTDKGYLKKTYAFLNALREDCFRDIPCSPYGFKGEPMFQAFVPLQIYNNMEYLPIIEEYLDKHPFLIADYHLDHLSICAFGRVTDIFIHTFGNSVYVKIVEWIEGVGITEKQLFHVVCSGKDLEVEANKYSSVIKLVQKWHFNNWIVK
jgi:hypothetical protein